MHDALVSLNGVVVEEAEVDLKQLATSRKHRKRTITAVYDRVGLALSMRVREGGGRCCCGRACIICRGGIRKMPHIFVSFLSPSMSKR